MIIKGASRGDPKQLAAHLLRADTNERVEVLELHSPIGELKEAFRDWQLLSEATRGTKGLYHATISPAKGYHMTEEQWTRSVDALEKGLGFDGQPRAVVRHFKEEREHIHVVWQRTDVENMKLLSDSWNFKVNEKVSQALELEFGHEHVPGKHAKRDREKQPEPPKSDINHAEWQQKERTGVDPRDRKEQVSELYAQSDSPQAFRAALAEEGYILATGDKRTYVLVDQAGEIYSLTRQLKGERAADVRAFLAPLERETIPDIEEARRQQAERPAPEPTPPNKDKGSQPKEEPPQETEEARRFREALGARQAAEGKDLLDRQAKEAEAARARLDEGIREKMETLQKKQAEERRALKEKQAAEKSILTRLDRKIRPEHAAKLDLADQKARDDLERRQAQKRQSQLARLRQARNTELDRLAERHMQETRELMSTQKAEAERYRQERAEAERLARELEQERKRQEEKARSRDGPERGPTR